MEIIYITESSGYGGAERYLIDLSTESKKTFEDVMVALPYNSRNAKLRDKLKSTGIRTIEIKQYMALYPLNFIIALKFFLSHKKSLFHFTLPHPDSCRWLLLAASLLRRRYVISELLVPPDPYKAGWYFFVTHLLFNAIKKFSYARAIKVIAICNEMKKTLVESYRMPSSKITVIYNGISPSPEISEESRDELRSQLDINKGSIVLTTIGRLTEQKGHIYLLTAFEKLAVEYPSVVLLLVGDGPLKNLLEAAIKSRHLTAKVKMTGFREDIANILAITDLFVFPSLNEGFPYMILESMAAGKPVVATLVTGTAEAIIDGETGLLCKTKDPDDLAEKLLLLLNNKDSRDEMGRKARERAVEKFDIKDMTSKTFALYELASSLP